MNIPKRKYLAIFLAVSLLLMLAGCGASTSDSFYGGSFDTINKGDSAILEENGSIGNFSDTTTQGNASSNESVTTNRKIIEEYDLRVETKEFDKLIENIMKEISRLGGYVENSSIDNNNDYRYADFTIRITQKNSSDFNSFVTENSNLVHSETTTKDVTLTYVDIESRIKSYKTEQEKLEELMANATSLTDVLSIQDRLTEVIYEIESYESQLRTYDNLIDYTTINLSVVEVEKETVTEKLTVWKRIGLNLKDGFENVGNFMTNFFVFAISSIPYLLLMGIPVLVVIIIVAIIKKSAKKKQQKKLPPH